MIRSTSIFLLTLPAAHSAELVFREDWKEIPAALPITQEHVANPNLQLTLHGPGKGGIKKSHHDKPADDPYYVWSGKCEMRWGISLRNRRKLIDLSGKDARIRLRSKQAGGRELRLLIKLPNERWFISEQGVGESKGWEESELKVAELGWRHFDIITIAAREEAPEIALDRIDEIGLTDLEVGGGSKACSRIDWIEVWGATAPRPATKKASPVKTQRVAAKLPAGVTSHEGLVYATYGKRKLLLDLYRPRANGPHPGVVFIHGGGWYKGDRSSYTPMAQQLAAEGYVTATIEYRLSGEAPFPAALHDCKAAVRWMREHAGKYGIDPTKIACIGGSAGGHLSGLVATSGKVARLAAPKGTPEYPSAVQAAVVMAGNMDLTDERTLEAAAADPRRRLITFMGGDWESAKQNYIDASPITHANANTPPMLFLDGEFDRPEIRYIALRKKLGEAGVKTEYHTIAKAPHPYWTMHPFFEPALGHIVDFLGRILKGEE